MRSSCAHWPYRSTTTTAAGSRSSAAARSSASSSRSGSMFQVVALGVDEAQVGAQVPGGVRRGDEGERRDPDLVTRLHPVQQQRQVQRGGSAGERDGRLDPAGLDDIGLEPVDLGPHRGDPVGVERRHQTRPVIRAHVRRREVETSHPSTVLERRVPGIRTARCRRRSATDPPCAARPLRPIGRHVRIGPSWGAGTKPSRTIAGPPQRSR